MDDNNTLLIKEKKLELWLGILFLLPAILASLSFVWCMCGLSFEKMLYGTPIGDDFAYMVKLGGVWDDEYNSAGGCAASPAPLFCALMGMVGAYLVKNNFRYLFIKTPKKVESKSNNNTPKSYDAKSKVDSNIYL